MPSYAAVLGQTAMLIERNPRLFVATCLAVGGLLVADLADGVTRLAIAGDDSPVQVDTTGSDCAPPMDAPVPTGDLDDAFAPTHAEAAERAEPQTPRRSDAQLRRRGSRRVPDGVFQRRR